MQKTKEIAKRMLTLFLAVLLSVGTMVPLIGTFEVHAVTATVETKTVKKSGLDYGYVATGKSGVISGMKGVCADPWHHPGTASATIYQIPNNHVMARLAYYYQIKGWNMSDGNKNRNGTSLSLQMSRAMSYARCATGFHISKSISQWKSELNSQNAGSKAINNAISLYNEGVGAVGAAPDNFVCYLCDCGSAQDAVVWKLVPAGNAYLRKVSSDAASASLAGYNNFSGITYGLYKADMATAVGTLYVGANGISNTITGLAPGQYYAKELATNAYYELNPSWIPAVVYSNNTTEIRTADAPKLGTAKVIKKEANGHDILSNASFTFHLVNRDNPTITYDLTVKGNGTPTAEGSVNVIAGTYDVTETSYSEGWVDTTGLKELIVKPGETAEIDWLNRQPGQGFLQVKKVTEDNGPLEGFTFKVEGILYNQGTLSSAEVIEAADPSVEIENADDYEAVGNWSVNSDDLAAINNAAENRENGDFNIRLTNKAEHKAVEGTTVADIVNAISPEPTEPGSGTIDEGTVIKNGNDAYKAKNDVPYEYSLEEDSETGDYTFDTTGTENNIKALLSDTSKFEKLDTAALDISITVPVSLKNVTWDTELDKFVDYTSEPADQTATGDGYSASFKSFDWHGAATIYKDLNTGRDYTILTTDVRGLTNTIERGICKGKITVTEQMSDSQAARYRQPEAQTQEVAEGEYAMFSFEFENKPYWTPVKLKKTSIDGNIANLEFRLTGTTAFGEQVSRTATTDAEGNIDFGNIHRGSYVVEELSFDKKNYINNHVIPGYGYPAIAFEVTGEETEDIVIDFENTPIASLYISKIDGDTIEFLENAEFELYEDGELAARFQIVKNDDGSAGVNMIWSNGVIEGRMSKTIVDPEPEDDEIVSDVDIPVGDDEDVTIIDGTGEQGGSDSGSDAGDETPSAAPEIDYNSLNWARLDNLSVGKTYTLKETKAPKGGYTVAAPYEFEMNEHSKRVVVENYIPEIKTSAKDSETGTRMSNADDEVTIIDTVSYTHLTPGADYVMKGTIYHRMKWLDDPQNPDLATETEEAVENNGKAVTAEKKFTADASGNGTVELEFTFDGSDLTGKGVVVYERCYAVKGETQTFVAGHEAPDDTKQTVFFPEIKTSAKDEDSKYDELGAISETEFITDTVEYTGLEPNKNYKMVATLYDKTTGKFILNSNGEKYTVEKEFTPGTSDGVVDVTFTIDSRDLIAHKIVAYEECWYHGDAEAMVAFHKNPDDEEQTIVYPAPSYDMYKIRITDASEKGKTGKYGFKPGDQVFYEVHVKNTGNCPITVDVRDEFEESAAKIFTLPVVEKVENAKQNSISEDKNVVNITIEKGETAVVTYSAEPLPAAPEYLAADKADSDSKDLENNDVNKVDEKNTPDNKDGYINTAYTENPTFPNPGNPDEQIPVPEGDKNDPAQTPIREPEIGTFLSDGVGRKELKPGSETTLIDSVAYAGLTPGQKYAVIGTLMVKDKNSPLVEEGTPVTAYATFVPTEENGIARVEFTVNTNAVKGKELVAFEVCYNINSITEPATPTIQNITEKGIKVASHEDINDKDQTVFIKNPKSPKTGDNMLVLWTGAIFSMAALTVVAMMLRRRKLNK